MYSEPLYFNYQSSELAKALLLFTKPGQININDEKAINFLKIYGANCFGLDKLSFDSRVRWVDRNVEGIINYNKDDTLIMKSKDKLLFTAFCIEYKRYIEHFRYGSGTLNTYLPIQLDATCNGYQHLNMLINQSKLFDVLNLGSGTTSDIPYDLYLYILDKVNKIINNKIKEGNLQGEQLDIHKRLAAFPFNRSMIKKAIMTFAYNAANITLVDYIVNELKYHCNTVIPRKKKENIMRNERKAENKKSRSSKNAEVRKEIDLNWYKASNDGNTLVNYNDIVLYVKYLLQFIQSEDSEVKKLKDYMRDMIKIYVSLNITMEWTIPGGLLVNNTYMKQLQIKPYSYSPGKINIGIYDGNKIDIRKMLSSLMPNLIHSLDASTLCKLYLNFKSSVAWVSKEQYMSFYSVHGCFATTADLMGLLIESLRMAYIKIYIDDDYLRSYH